MKQLYISNNYYRIEDGMTVNMRNEGMRWYFH